MNELYTWTDLEHAETDINRSQELLSAGFLTSKDLSEFEPIWIKQPHRYIKPADGAHDLKFIPLDSWYEAWKSRYLPQCTERDYKGIAQFEYERCKQGDRVVETYEPITLVKDKESDFPVLVFASNSGNKLYLSPFRGYCFQFSGTINGEGDFGSNEVVGLSNILSANYRTGHFKKGYQSNVSPDRTGRYMLRALIEAAAYKASVYNSITQRAIYIPTICEGMNMFIDATIEWLNS